MGACACAIAKGHALLTREKQLYSSWGIVFFYHEGNLKKTRAKANVKVWSYCNSITIKFGATHILDS